MNLRCLKHARWGVQQALVSHRQHSFQNRCPNGFLGGCDSNGRTMIEGLNMNISDDTAAGGEGMKSSEPGEGAAPSGESDSGALAVDRAGDLFSLEAALERMPGGIEAVKSLVPVFLEECSRQLGRSPIRAQRPGCKTCAARCPHDQRRRKCFCGNAGHGCGAKN